ncbi:basement membrane-specific heparan sulfate proteoglycan core protein-like isoform X1 [Osmerus mordax]|uniref:basement membrane-specific heparan sulfate proteoglycan core protein-like isoform X1 n=1 Tax=Osmerus mordax TaxID=8014 RepID=UPI00351072B2
MNSSEFTIPCFLLNNPFSNHNPIRKRSSKADYFRTVGAQAPVLSLEPRVLWALQGGTASLRCQVVSGTQPVHLEWRRTNNQPLPNNVKIGPDGSVLTVAGVRSANQGQYRCIATSPSGRSTATATLTIRMSPKVRVTPAGPLRVRLGEPVSLECRATGRPRPSVTWQHQGSTHQLVTTATDDTRTLQVAAARPEDSGVYMCQARNSEGVAEAKVEVVVDGGQGVSMAPVASVTKAEITAVEGRTITMECRARGSPPPVITWSKLRAPLPWRHRVEGGVLTLTSVGRQDSGQYICNATNTHGTSQAYTQMEVDSPPYTTCLPDQLQLRPGDALRIQCLAHGTHPITFLWTRVGGAALPQGAETTQDGKLLIGQVQMTDSGSYKCLASNHVGSSEALARVTVKA